MKLDLVVLASCFATSEGFFAPGNPPPVRNNNPGDLRFYNQDGALESEDGRVFDAAGKKVLPGFAKWGRKEQGTCALLRQLCAYCQRGYTLTQAVDSWAPPKGPDGGNNSALYLSETIRRYKAATGDTIDPNVPLWDFLVLSHIP